MTPRAGTTSRVASGLGGALVLLLSAFFTVGTSLAAPLGVLVARAWARRKQRPLTGGASWIGAVTASSLAVVALFALLAGLVPPGSFRQSLNAVAAARTQPSAKPPGWLAKVFPEAADRPNPAVERILGSPLFLAYFSLLGAAIACLFLGSIAGTAGWVGTLLLGYALTGRGPP